MTEHRVFKNEFPYDSGRYSGQASPNIRDLIEWLTTIDAGFSEKHSIDSISTESYKNGLMVVSLSVEIEG